MYKLIYENIELNIDDKIPNRDDEIHIRREYDAQDD